MSSPRSSSAPCESAHSSDSDPKLDATIAKVQWEKLSEIACKLYGVRSARWGEQLSGGYNVVRFLHLAEDSESNTVLVARFPFLPEEGWTDQHSVDVSSRIESEVATMRYVEAHTTIPVPRVIHYCPEADGGGVGSPYILMTKVDGVPLSSVWDDMEDRKRDVVLRQLVDILLELSRQRFDKIGSLFQRGDGSWYVGASPSSPEESNSRRTVLSTTF